MRDYSGPMQGKWGMMGNSHDLLQNPLFLLGILVHIAFAVLFFLILFYLAMYLKEKVRAERYANRKLEKGK